MEIKMKIVRKDIQILTILSVIITIIGWGIEFRGVVQTIGTALSFFFAGCLSGYNKGYKNAKEGVVEND